MPGSTARLSSAKDPWVRHIPKEVNLNFALSRRIYCSNPSIFANLHTELWSMHDEELPELKVLMATISMTEDELNQSEKSKKLFVWYYDVFLPAAVLHGYGNDVRHYKEYTAKVSIHGKEKVAVPPKVEAFALLIYDNCVGKWNFQYSKKKENPNARIAAHCPENRGKYTYIAKGPDGAKDRSEAVCGFTKAGQDKLVEMIKFVKQRRADDAKDGTKTAKLALKLMREKHNIEADTVTQPKGTKRRRVEKTAPQLPPQEMEDSDEE